MLSVPDDVWRLTCGALRPALAALIAAYSLSLSNQNFLTLGLMAIICAVLVVGTMPNFGVALVSGIVATITGVFTACVTSPIAYALAGADPHVRNVLLPFITFFYTFFAMLTPVVGGPVGFMSVIIGWVIMGSGAVHTADNWDIWFGAKVILTVVVGIAIGWAMHLIPLPTPAWRVSTGVSQCEALLLRCRTLMAALLRRTVENIAAGEDAEAATLAQIAATLLAALDEFAASLGGAKIELLLCRRKPQIARLMLWLKLLRHQFVHLEHIMRIANSRPYLGAYPKFRAHISGPVVTYADAVAKVFTAPDVDAVPAEGGVVTLPPMPKETAALVAAYEAARTAAAEGEFVGTSDPLQLDWLDPLAATAATAATTPTPAPNTDGKELATIVARSRTEALIATLLALQTAPVDRLSMPLPSLSLKTSLRCSKLELMRAFKLALTMGIGALWVAIPQLQERANGHGIWVNLAVANVELSDTGMTYQKTIDRLWGTLLAVAFGLFLSNSTALESEDAAAVLTSVWVFGCFYMRGVIDAAYAGRAAISASTAIVLVFYPTVLVHDYEPGVGDFAIQRITMVVYGCVLSVLVTLFVFPESPRAAVEAAALNFMPLLHKSIGFAADALRLGTATAAASTSFKSHGDSGAGATEAASAAAEATEQLRQHCTALDASTAAALKTMPAAVAEPYAGFSVPFAAAQYASLLTLQRRATPALLRMLNRLGGTYDALRETRRTSINGDTASALPSLLALLARQVELCAEQSEALFGGDATAAAATPSAAPSPSPHTALSAFRGFGSLRLDAARIWSAFADDLSVLAAGEGPVEIDRRLLCATSLFMSEVVEFSHVMEQIGAAFEALAATSPQLLATAVSEAKSTPAPTPGPKTERSAVPPGPKTERSAV